MKEILIIAGGLAAAYMAYRYSNGKSLIPSSIDDFTQDFGGASSSSTATNSTAPDAPSKTLGDYVTGAINYTALDTSKIITATGNAITTIGTAAANTAANIASGVATVGYTVGKTLGDVYASTVQPIVQKVSAAATSAVSSVTTAVTNAVSSVGKTLGDVYNTAAQTVSSISSSVGKTLGDIYSWLK